MDISFCPDCLLPVLNAIRMLLSNISIVSVDIFLCQMDLKLSELCSSVFMLCVYFSGMSEKETYHKFLLLNQVSIFWFFKRSQYDKHVFFWQIRKPFRRAMIWWRSDFCTTLVCISKCCCCCCWFFASYLLSFQWKHLFGVSFMFITFLPQAQCNIPPLEMSKTGYVCCGLLSFFIVDVYVKQQYQKPESVVQSQNVCYLVNELENLNLHNQPNSKS